MKMLRRLGRLDWLLLEQGLYDGKSSVHGLDEFAELTELYYRWVDASVPVFLERSNGNLD